MHNDIPNLRDGPLSAPFGATSELANDYNTGGAEVDCGGTYDRALAYTAALFGLTVLALALISLPTCPACSWRSVNRGHEGMCALKILKRIITLWRFGRLSLVSGESQVAPDAILNLT